MGLIVFVVFERVHLDLGVRQTRTHLELEDARVATSGDIIRHRHHYLDTEEAGSFYLQADPDRVGERSTEERKVGRVIAEGDLVFARKGIHDLLVIGVVKLASEPAKRVGLASVDPKSPTALMVNLPIFDRAGAEALVA